MLGAIALATAVLAGGETAAATRESVIQELSRSGFGTIRIQRTWLGRTRIIGTGPEGTREVILNPSTGQILRDHVEPAEPDAEAPAGGATTGAGGGAPAPPAGGGAPAAGAASAGGGAPAPPEGGGAPAGGAAAPAGGGAAPSPADDGGRAAGRAGDAGGAVGEAVEDAAGGAGGGAVSGVTEGAADAVEDALDDEGLGGALGAGE